MAAVGEVTQGEDQAVGDRKAGETATCMPDFPGEGGALFRPRLEQAGLSGEPVAIGAAPLRPVGQRGSAQSGESAGDQEETEPGAEGSRSHDG